MKTLLSSILSAVIGGVLTVIVIKLFFTDKPDLVFTLSSPIYTSLSVDNREGLQELTIKNNGEKRAERIIVSTQINIGEYEIKKYAHTDTFDLMKGPSNFELVYPSLPPDGELKILFKNVAEEISVGHLTVRHEDGIGTDALKKPEEMDLRSTTFAFTAISACLLSGCLILMMIVDRMKNRINAIRKSLPTMVQSILDKQIKKA